ncbi:hypothetical protein F3Y22_tig00110569pilonHSYRG00193 [Hibiscus syriacus]|uniref:Pentatricopeptide repeat-containing protein n=1 Tax=Hibiscus syriacus TaxID=106335 RepID=A0A6A3AA73_HIBSY|nr:hypothetical protein F3Y22_tig00110569pilonHSYRG00193 [Hibiscus syriacus]
MKLIDGRPGVVIYNLLINGYLKNGDFEEALSSLGILDEKGCRPNVGSDLVIDFSRKGLLPKGFDYCGLVEKLCGEADVARAFRVVNVLWMNGNVPSLIACTTLIEGLRRSQRRDDAFELMEKMLKDALFRIS